MSQFLINQVYVSNSRGHRLWWPQPKLWLGRNPFLIRSMFPTTRDSLCRSLWYLSVAIPYSSGLCFQQMEYDRVFVHAGQMVAIPYSSGLYFQLLSKVAQVIGQSERSQSLIDQVSVSNIDVFSYIGMKVQSSQSLIHQVSVSNSYPLKYA